MTTTTTTTKPTVRPGVKTSTDPHRCRRQCPGGYQCQCDGTVIHVLHLCSNPHCVCHDRARYEPEEEPAQ
jgi:hypothetical protein